jgi:hypothetical protein
VLTGEVAEHKTRIEFLALCDKVRARYPAEIRLAFVLDNFSPHKGTEMRGWAHANNVEFAYTPHYASWLNRIEPQFKGLHYFCLAGTDHPDHETQTSAHQRLHRLAQRSPRQPQTPPPHPKRTRTQSRPQQHGKRCLMIH